MSHRIWCLGATAIALLVLSQGTAQAQPRYPSGYGHAGWNGWGGGAKPTAAGMGAFAAGSGQAAAGAGQRNVDNSQARAQNAQTMMGVNNYMYECQQRNNQAYWSRQAQKQADNVNAINTMQDRILNHPQDGDIANGDSLNALYLVLTDPQIYEQTLDLAQQPMRGTVVKIIPFEKDSQGITYSLEELTSRDTVPQIFKRAEFDGQRASVRAIASELRKESIDQKSPKSATIKKFRTAIDGVKQTLEGIDGLDDQQKFEAEKYLKALYGLTRMIDSPAYDVFLASVDQEPNVPLAEVLTFMHAFSLKFGPSKTPEQREVYSQIYGQLSKLRNQVAAPAGNSPPAANNNPPPPQNGGRDNRITDFYGGMSYDHARGPGGASPPPPAPGGSQ